MTLGTQPQQSGTMMPRRGFFESIRGLAAAVVLMLSAMVFLAGCGGGSSNNPGNGDNGNGSGTATITGRLVNRYGANAGIPGVTLVYARGTSNEKSVTSGADGSFSLTVKSGIGASTLQLVDPTTPATYYDVASVQGTTYSVKSSGIAIPAIPATDEDTTVSLGEIGLFTNTGPPPPPVF